MGYIGARRRMEKAMRIPIGQGLWEVLWLGCQEMAGP